MSGNPNDSSSPAPPASRSRRNRRVRSPDAGAQTSNGAAPGSTNSRPSFQPIAPRGSQGQGQGQGTQARTGSGLHQTIHNHYHYSPYEGTNGSVNGYDSSNGRGNEDTRNGQGGVGVGVGNGGPGSAVGGGGGVGSGEGPLMGARGGEWEFAYPPQGRGHGEIKNQNTSSSQGYDFPAANTHGYWPGPGQRPPSWFPPPGQSMIYPPQNGGGGGAPSNFYMGIGWGRSPYGA
ncbi:hypothetical protein IWZ01DRAFT_522812 [Phyllosticta capitalensis]